MSRQGPNGRMRWANYPAAQRYASKHHLRIVEVINEKGEMRLNCVSPAGKPRTLRVEVAAKREQES
jgi:hypothetical protein